MRVLVAGGVFLALTSSLAAQAVPQNRQAYLGLLYYVHPAEADKFIDSNRQYSTALAAHGVSDRLLHWTAYAQKGTYTYLWLYPIEHLNDIEELARLESQIDERIDKERWNVGSDLHYAVDHTEEFVIRDEPSLSRLPEDMEAWTHQTCRFKLYYTSGGYGGSDSEIRKLWRSYRDVISKSAQPPSYRIMRVLIGLQRPLWVVQRCGSSFPEIGDQESQERKLAGAAGLEMQQKFLSYVSKVEVWDCEFDAGMSYPTLSGSKSPR